jgi:hypothetical protein
MQRYLKLQTGDIVFLNQFSVLSFPVRIYPFCLWDYQSTSHNRSRTTLRRVEVLTAFGLKRNSWASDPVWNTFQHTNLAINIDPLEYDWPQNMVLLHGFPSWSVGIFSPPTTKLFCQLQYKPLLDLSISVDRAWIVAQINMQKCEVFTWKLQCRNLNQLCLLVQNPMDISTIRRFYAFGTVVRNS